MSGRTLAENQPAEFVWSAENAAWAEQQIAKYPQGRQASAVIPLLWRGQKQEGWVTIPMMEAIARQLAMPYIRVLEVATFYTMFNLEPVGEFFVQLCGTTPCMLCGAEELKKVCREKIGPQREITADGKLSWLEVECLGACVNAPMVQINDYYYEDLNADSFAKILDDLRAGREVAPGNFKKRQTSAPAGEPTSLTDPSLYDGSRAAPLAAIPNAPGASPANE